MVNIHRPNVFNSIFMSLSEIYSVIDTMRQVPPAEMYNILIKTYSKTKVEFIMYNLFNYDYLNIEQREKRKDAEFKKNVRTRYNNECIITGTDIPVQVCHIIPFSQCDSNEKYNINNGILLRDDIHMLFDNGYIKINPDTLCVEIAESIMKNKKCYDYHKYDGMIVKISKTSLCYLRRVYCSVIKN